jgi:acetoacetyl-CoA synthetase
MKSGGSNQESWQVAECVWKPDAGDVAASALKSFSRLAEARTGLELETYSALHEWSIRDSGAFWSLIWEFCDVIGERGVGDVIASNEMPGARFFPDARLNFAENLLRRRDHETAIVFVTESGNRRELSFDVLYASVARVASWLAQNGIGVGDRVAACLPNTPETIIAMLATTSLGGVWSSCSPDFGTAGIVDRFSQIAPKILLCTDAYDYGGKRIDTASRIPEILVGLPSVERCVLLPYSRDGVELDAEVVLWEEVDRIEDPAPEIEFKRLPVDHPLYILFSSGTTGKPKCIVHGAGGTLLQHLKEHRLHVDLGSSDRLFYFTTCGWMMWNWLVSALASGTRIILYEGSPFHPDGETLWRMAERERVTVFGTSAKFIDSCSKEGIEPGERFDLSAVRTILSTGSPLSPEGFDYVHRHVSRDAHLASISGGTDIISCFVLGNPTAPVFRGELQCAGLGMDVAVFDDEGRPIVGQPGELVCRTPFPSMPIGFFNDEDGALYRAAYFDRFPGVWCQGDWCTQTERGGYVIHGRSDAVLNPGGVRIGTAEIYRQVETFDEVIESIAIGQSWEDDVRVVLFVKLRDGVHLDDTLMAELRRRIRKNASPRHVPARIVEVMDIPRTRSGKITELAVRDVVHGRDVKNVGALANPEALDYFRDRVELSE